MTHSIRFIACSVLGFLFIATTSQAQNLVAVNATAQGENIISYTATEGEQSSTTALSGTTLVASNPKLIRNFSQLFPASDKVIWSKLDNGYYVSFEKDGQHTRAAFTNNGLLNYSVASCILQQLPVSLQQNISKKYSSYHLFNASLIRTNGTESYRVILENTAGFVTLQHTEDGTEEIGKVNKLAVN